jgi:hypothetical protein
MRFLTGRQLDHVSDDLKNDKDFILQIFRISADEGWRFAQAFCLGQKGKLKTDREFFLSLVGHSPPDFHVQRFIPAELRDDPEIQRVVEARNETLRSSSSSSRLSYLSTGGMRNGSGSVGGSVGGSGGASSSNANRNANSETNSNANSNVNVSRERNNANVSQSEAAQNDRNNLNVGNDTANTGDNTQSGQNNGKTPTITFHRFMEMK